MTIQEAFIKAVKSLWKTLPLVLGTVLLVSLVTAVTPTSLYLQLFSKNIWVDSILGSVLGSISAGTPVVSYIFGGELLQNGVGVIPVTAFLVSWVTVGVVQFPAEAGILGREFAVLRNGSSFLLSIIVALVTVFIINLI